MDLRVHGRCAQLEACGVSINARLYESANVQKLQSDSKQRDKFTSPQVEDLRRLNIRAVAPQKCAYAAGRIVLNSLSAVIRRHEWAVGYRLGSAARAHERLRRNENLKRPQENANSFPGTAYPRTHRGTLDRGRSRPGKTLVTPAGDRLECVAQPEVQVLLDHDEQQCNEGKRNLQQFHSFLFAAQRSKTPAGCGAIAQADGP